MTLPVRNVFAIAFFISFGEYLFWAARGEPDEWLPLVLGDASRSSGRFATARATQRAFSPTSLLGQLPLEVLGVEMTLGFRDPAVIGQTPIFPATYLNPIAGSIRS